MNALKFALSRLGGEDKLENLTVACRDCNSGKSSSVAAPDTVASVDEDAVRWAAAMRRAAQMQQEQAEEALFLIEYFDEAWQSWRVGADKDLIWRPGDWQKSIASFHAAGVSVAELQAAVVSAMGNQKVTAFDTWRYFCGIVWNKLRERQQMAMEILKAEESTNPWGESHN
jgi:hypothetical protein